MLRVLKRDNIFSFFCGCGRKWAIITHRKDHIMAEKRTVAAEEKTGLRNINNLIFVGIMMAVGIVLRLCASFIAIAGMHPNFLIATYCLAIYVIRPNVREAAIIGIISGFISQIGTSMPWLNLGSELLGAIAMCLLCKVIATGSVKSVKVLICTFLSTCVSGFTFVALAALTYARPMPFAQFLSMAATTVVTAALNCIIVTVLAIPADKILNK